MTTTETGTISASTPDVQAGRPATQVSLTRVGVRGVEKVIQVAGDHFFAELECFVDLNPQQAGVHMSRFEEIVNETIDEVVLAESPIAEGL
ncbi:MAG TPA: GTP cyclohydrolase, FolE2/MptA family, partial [Solirubrobacterales bacterium]|nr:GTP cyclohydrolase, FolE2/MptA family [Solirubrobacterales bacterium]